ncbi:hypothetical protein S40293_09490, partial [Stachybotrys chartarum IBT 40293]
MTTKPSSLSKPQKSKSMAIPYPSPPNSPHQTKSPNPEVPKVPKDKARPAETVFLAPLGLPTAPLRHSFASTAYNKPEENKDDISELNTRLGLDSGLCGGLTRFGRPCRCLPPGVNKDIVLGISSR